MFKIQTVLNFSMKNQIFLSSKIHKRNSEWTCSKFTYFRPNLEPNFKLSYWFSSIKNLFFLSKNKRNWEFKDYLIVRKSIIRRLEPNLKLYRSNSAEPFFKKFYQKSQALFSKNRNSKWTFYSKFIFHQDRLFQHKISVWTTQILRLSNIGQHPGSQAVSETVWTRAC